MIYLDRFLEYLQGLPDFLIYFFLGLSAFMENIFPPLPGDTITVFGAFLVGRGQLALSGVYLSTTIGSFLGFISLFWAGIYLGRKYFIKKDYRFFSEANIIRVENWFMKYGYFIILLNRFFTRGSFSNIRWGRDLRSKHPKSKCSGISKLFCMEFTLYINGIYPWKQLGHGKSKGLFNTDALQPGHTFVVSWTYSIYYY